MRMPTALGTNKLSSHSISLKQADAQREQRFAEKAIMEEKKIA